MADINMNQSHENRAPNGDKHDEINGMEPLHLTPSRAAHFEATHPDPARWWFIDSAFPMIAGTLGPVANAFSICALAQPWRTRHIPDTDIRDTTDIADPPWLLAVNAVQLVLALISNFTLLLNMARRLRFTIAQPITIGGWYLSAICLTCLCATAAGPLFAGLENEDEYICSQAFWYGVWAAILYFVVATLMSITFWGAYTGRFGKSFNLTTSQRTLMFQTILFLMYLLIGALIFHTTEPDWKYLDALYWADVTLFTVGFGDFATTTQVSRGLLIPYALVGVISLGLVISSIRKMILDHARRHVGIRMQEKTRKNLVRRVTMKGNDYILQPVGSLPRQDTETQSNHKFHNEYDRRRVEFELMRKVQRKALIRRRWTAMATSTGTWLVFWLLGALIFLEFEKPYQAWSYFDAFYLCFVTLTTIGYGDRTPISPGGKSFFVFWSLLALPTMTVLISNAEDTVVKFIRDTTNRIGDVTVLPAKSDRKARRLMRVKHREEEAGRAAEEAASTSITVLHPDPSQHAQHKRKVHKQDKDKGVPLKHAATISDGVAPHVNLKTRLLEPLPTGRKLHLLLVNEVQKVAKHINDKTKHHYTFDEWAWYLKLLGEDESNPDTHSKAKVRAKKHHTPGSHSTSAQESPPQIQQAESAHPKWSWVGHRSPLGAGQDESEWIIEHLVLKLEESLIDGLGH